MRKKKVKGSGLSILQKMKLKQHCSDSKTIRQMADFIGANYQVTYDYIIKNNLPAKMIQTANARRKHKYETRLGMFNVGITQNWLI